MLAGVGQKSLRRSHRPLAKAPGPQEGHIPRLTRSKAKARHYPLFREIGYKEVCGCFGPWAGGFVWLLSVLFCFAF